MKTDKYYLVDHNAFRKIAFYNYHDELLAKLAPYYFTSKQFYLTRKFTYNSFTNIIRQICKSNNVMFTSQMKYNESKYSIIYMIYFAN